MKIVKWVAISPTISRWFEMRWARDAAVMWKIKYQSEKFDFNVNYTDFVPIKLVSALRKWKSIPSVITCFYLTTGSQTWIEFLFILLKFCIIFFCLPLRFHFVLVLLYFPFDYWVWVLNFAPFSAWIQVNTQYFYSFTVWLKFIFSFASSI